MRWDQGNDSPDLIDRRGEGGGGGGVGGLLGLAPLLLRVRGGWAILLVIVAFSMCGIGRSMFGGGGDAPRAHGGGPAASAHDTQAKFVGFVLDDTQAQWSAIFAKRGDTYRHAKLVLFTDSTSTGCGYGRAATGPFYSPQDERVYIDLGFYKELEDKLGARGEFAKAYVIAHEIGHHVQKQLGITDKVAHLKGNASGATGSSVRLELQADCFAGIWAHTTEERKLLENGDMEEALQAATAIGDDRLQKQSTGTVSPEKWTHGSSAERVQWFKTGYKNGTIEACDTFASNAL